MQLDDQQEQRVDALLHYLDDPAGRLPYAAHKARQRAGRPVPDRARSPWLETLWIVVGAILLACALAGAPVVWAALVEGGW